MSSIRFPYDTRGGETEIQVDREGKDHVRLTLSRWERHGSLNITGKDSTYTSYPAMVDSYSVLIPLQEFLAFTIDNLFLTRSV